MVGTASSNGISIHALLQRAIKGTVMMDYIKISIHAPIQERFLNYRHLVCLTISIHAPIQERFAFSVNLREN